jgi:hypothetical protein
MTDSSGNANDGTLYNVQTTGTGYMFDGATSKVVVPNSATLNPGSNDFSYLAHVKTSTLPPAGGDYDVIRKGAADTTGGGYRMEIQTHHGLGEAYCSISDSTGHTISVRGNTNIVDGVLHTVTCQKTSSGLTLLVDSLTPQTTSGSIGSISNTKPLLLGVKAPNYTGVGGDWYKGRLRGVTISLSH